jgi:hypothetical protein
MWTRSESSRREATAPTPAPAIVPKEKLAWKRGMIDLPSRCSTAAPSRFIAASHTPMPTPERKRPTTAGGNELPATPHAASTKPATLTTAKSAMARRAPNRWTIQPESGRAMIEPTAPTSTSRPISEGSKPRRSRTSGIRDAQLAKLNPLRKKTAYTAFAACRTTREVPSSVLIRRLVPSRG